MLPDYYEILGVGRSADQETVKKAFVRKARQWHPDRHEGDAEKQNAEAKFKLANAAYEVLRNTSTRASYDRELRDSKSSSRDRDSSSSAPQSANATWSYSPSSKADNVRHAEQRGYEVADRYSRDYDEFSRYVEQLLRRAGKAAVSGGVALAVGEKKWRESSEGKFGTIVGAGCLGWIAVALISLVFTGVGGIITYFGINAIRGSLTDSRGRFIGIGPVLMGMMFWAGVLLVVPQICCSD